MRVLLIDGRRTAYSIDQILDYTRTMTVGELRNQLEAYDDEMPVMLINDNGYTYGEIEDGSFEVKTVDYEPEEEDE